jgi:hypothetical protein
MRVPRPGTSASNPRAMKHTPILLLTLVAASAAAAPYGVVHDLNYNRLGVGYETDKYLKSVVVSGEAKLGEYLLVGGSYSDVTGKGADVGLNGKFSRFGLGLAFNAGPGDLILRATYGQGNLESADFSAFGVADETSVGLSYRAALGNGFEGELGYARVHNRVAGTNLDAAAAFIKNDNVVKASLRYDITKNIDVTVSYAFRSSVVGGNSFGLSAGYSF